MAEVKTCGDALEYNIYQVFRQWTRLGHTPREARGVEFRLEELAWLSALAYWTLRHHMLALTNALQFGAPVWRIADAMGIARGDVAAIRAVWEPWARQEVHDHEHGYGLVSGESFEYILRVLADAEAAVR
ncbi:hypothetical protein ACFWYW_14690 [Nonomuraea sp. NPDC059023]|uniref:hypothetical protein n=1 Tax=unclassified Nonomuraea TaxID=2593643 RepID=UPI0036CDE1BF